MLAYIRPHVPILRCHNTSLDQSRKFERCGNSANSTVNCTCVCKGGLILEIFSLRFNSPKKGATLRPWELSLWFDSVQGRDLAFFLGLGKSEKLSEIEQPLAWSLARESLLLLLLKARIADKVSQRHKKGFNLITWPAYLRLNFKDLQFRHEKERDW